MKQNNEIKTDEDTVERSFGRHTDRSRNYIAGVGEQIDRRSPQEVAARIREIVAAHDEWRSRDTISLNAAENVLSEQARRLLSSDMATRVTEGFPGHKDFPADRQNRFVDEIEASVIHMLRRLFDVKHVEWRPVSTSMANATVFFTLTEPGDIILVQSESAGGNYSYNPAGPTRAARLDVRSLPFLEETFEVDLDRARQAIREHRPKLVVIGGSNVLFPYPVSELRELADEVGAKLVYDAAHLALFIPFGLFQDPLREGAHIVTLSSHKIMSGAVGGIILTNDDDIAEKILPYSFPTLIQTRDQNKYAATAHALAEMAAFGEDYARQMLSNARALARALEQQGLEVLCADRNYTETHQIFTLVSGFGRSEEEIEDVCQRANLLVTRAQRMGDRSALRLTSQEVTRRGMREEDMEVIAHWLRRLIVDGENPSGIAGEVHDFLKPFQTLRFSFDGLSLAATSTRSRASA